MMGDRPPFSTKIGQLVEKKLLNIGIISIPINDLINRVLKA